jgi:hypothetical protein
VPADRNSDAKSSSPFSALNRAPTPALPSLSLSYPASYTQNTSKHASWPASIADISHTAAPTMTWPAEAQTPTKIAAEKNAEGTVSPFTAMKRTPVVPPTSSSSPYKQQAHAPYTGPAPILSTSQPHGTGSPQKLAGSTVQSSPKSLRSHSGGMENIAPTVIKSESESSMNHKHMSVPLNLELQVHTNNEDDDDVPGSESLTYASSSRVGSSSSQQTRGLHTSSSSVAMEAQQPLSLSNSYTNVQPTSSKSSSGMGEQQPRTSSSASSYVNAQKNLEHGDGKNDGNGCSDQIQEDLLRSLVCMHACV